MNPCTCGRGSSAVLLSEPIHHPFFGPWKSRCKGGKWTWPQSVCSFPSGFPRKARAWSRRGHTESRVFHFCLLMCVRTWGSLFSSFVGFAGISTRKDNALEAGYVLKNWGWFQSAITLLVQIKHDMSCYSTSRRNFYIVLRTPESLQPSAGSQSLWNTSCSEEQRLVKRMECLNPHFFSPREVTFLCLASLLFGELNRLSYCTTSNSWVMITNMPLFGELVEKMNSISPHTWGAKALVERNLSHREPLCTLQ